MQLTPVACLASFALAAMAACISGIRGARARYVPPPLRQPRLSAPYSHVRTTPMSSRKTPTVSHDTATKGPWRNDAALYEDAQGHLSISDVPHYGSGIAAVAGMQQQGDG